MGWQEAVLKAAVSVLVEVATGKKIKVGGCLPGKDNPRTARDFKRRRQGALPRQVDLRPTMSAVEDQSAVNSCAANAIVGMYEYLAKRSLGESGDISRLFVYWNARREDGIRGDRGSTLTGNIRALEDVGACTEQTWPYKPDLVDVKPNDDAYQEASRFMLEAAERVPVDLDAMRACLAEGYPFAFGLKLFRTFDRAGRHGVVPRPGSGALGRRSHGRHAMLAVGYSDSQQVFVVRNSWGERWGDRGYCYIPYDYMANRNYCSDCWTIRAVSDLDFQPGDGEDEGFYDEEETAWDPSIPSEYSFTEVEKAAKGAMIGIAAGFVVDDEEEEDLELHIVRIACGGLQDPSIADPYTEFFSSMDGVHEVRIDVESLVVQLAVDLETINPDDIWAAIENDPVLQPSWIE